MNAKNLNLFNRFQMNKNDYWDTDEDRAVELFQQDFDSRVSEEEIREMYLGNFSAEEFGEYVIMITGADVPEVEVIGYGVDYALHNSIIEVEGYYFWN